MFFMDGVPAPGTSVAELEAALRTALRKVIDEGVSDEELQRVKAQVIAGRVFQRDSMFYQAMQMGMLNTVGLPYDSADLQERKLREVTGEQVREVARKYFVDDNLTVAVLDPQSVAPRAAAPAN
jgi:zinc protease